MILGSEIDFNYTRLCSLINLKQLDLGRWVYTGPDYLLNINILATNLMYLEKLTLNVARSDEIFHWLCHAVNLKRMRITDLYEESNDATMMTCLSDLEKWNREREKLANARKVIIYVQESVYLATKWTLKDVDLSRVAIRRDGLDYNQNRQ